MATRRWTPVSYSRDRQLPLEGEIILLRYPFSNINFSYGPASVYSSHATAFSTTVSSSRWGIGPDKIHHVLVLSVGHDWEYSMINLTFMPIMSYSSATRNDDPWMSREATPTQQLHHLPIPSAWWTPPPPIYSQAPVLSFGSWVNDRRAWLGMITVDHDIHESEQWCRHPAGPVILDGDVSRLTSFLVLGIAAGLREIRTAAARARIIAIRTTVTSNIAATAIDPTENATITATAIDPTRNVTITSNIAAMATPLITASPNDTTITATAIDPTVTATTTSNIAAMATNLITASPNNDAAITTINLVTPTPTTDDGVIDTTPVAETTALTTVTAPTPTTDDGTATTIADNSTGITTPPTTTLEGPVITAAHTVMLPYDYNVWAEIYGHNFGGVYDAHTLGRIECENPITDEEIDSAMLGDDDIDPISFWNFPGSPEALLEIAQAHEKQTLDNMIDEWCAGGAVDTEELDCETDFWAIWEGETSDLGDDEIGLGEEACGEK